MILLSKTFNAVRLIRPGRSSGLTRMEHRPDVGLATDCPDDKTARAGRYQALDTLAECYSFSAFDTFQRGCESVFTKMVILSSLSSTKARIQHHSGQFSGGAGNTDAESNLQSRAIPWSCFRKSSNAYPASKWLVTTRLAGVAAFPGLLQGCDGYDLVSTPSAGLGLAERQTLTFNLAEMPSTEDHDPAVGSTRLLNFQPPGCSFQR